MSQNDQGLFGLFDHGEWPNVLVLSAGGYGHVALPLLKQEEPVWGSAGSRGFTGEGFAAPLASRPYLASFTGTIKHGPGHLRERVAADLASGACAGGGSGNAHACRVYSGGDWREVMADSRVSLNPRGFGRTSYHLAETVQLGLVPLHVYADEAWVPYPDTVFPALGFTTDVGGLPALLDHLGGAEAEAILAAKEAAARSFRDSHFTCVLPPRVAPCGSSLHTFKNNCFVSCSRGATPSGLN